MRLSPEILSLLHHVELHRTGWWEHAMEQAVVAVLWRSRPHSSLQAVGHTLRLDFGLSVDDTVLRATLQSLDADRKVLDLGDGRYKLAEDEISRVERELQAHGELEARVHQRYQDALGPLAEQLGSPAGAFDELLQRFLVPLIEFIGADTWRMLLNKGYREDIPQIAVDNYVSIFPTDVQEPLRQAVFAFLDPSHDDVRRYILRLLIAHFFVQAASIDAYTVELLQKELKNQPLELVLDTDLFLGAVLLEENDLDRTAGPSIIAGIVESASFESDCRLYVGYPSFREVREDIAILRELTARHRLDADISRARERRNAELYRRIHRASSVPHKAALDFYDEHLEVIAQEHGIEALNRPTEEEILANPELGRDLDWIEGVASSSGAGAKTRREWEHDIALWHIVDTQRGPVAESILQARWWLLTDDYDLIAFDQDKSQDAKRVQICLHPAAALQLMQFFVPRTDAWQRSIIELLRSPALFFGLERQTEDAVQHILDAENLWIRSGAEAGARDGLMNNALKERIRLTDEFNERVEAARLRLRDMNLNLIEEVAATRARLAANIGGDLTPDQERNIESALLQFTQNIVEVAGDHAGPIQQSGRARYESVLEHSDRLLLEAVIESLEVALRDEPPNEDAAEDAQAVMSTVASELRRKRPNMTVLGESVSSLRSIVESAAGGGLYVGIADLLGRLPF